MGRTEFRYGIKLAKLQMRYCNAVYIFVIVLYLVNMIFDNYVGIVVANFIGGEHFYIDRVSTGIGLVLAIYAFVFCWMEIMYGKLRTSQEIYPQNNKSRFVANAIGKYAFILFMTLLSMIRSIALMVLLPALEKSNHDLALTSNLMIRDVFIIGAVVFGYGILIQSMLLFLFSCIRKFKLWMYVFLLMIIMWLTNDYNSLFTVIYKMIQFYSNEEVLMLFLCKTIATFLVLTFLSYVLGIYTEFHSEQMGKKQVLSFVGLVVGTFVIIIIGVGNLSFTVYTDDVETETFVIENGFYETSDCNVSEIDVSHLEQGSEIEIETVGKIEVQEEDNWSVTDWSDDQLRVVCKESLIVEGDTIYLEYYEGSARENGVDLFTYLEPQFTYELDGNTLRLCYEMKNPNVYVIDVSNRFAEQFNPESEMHNRPYWLSGGTLSRLYIEMS